MPSIASNAASALATGGQPPIPQLIAGSPRHDSDRSFASRKHSS